MPHNSKARVALYSGPGASRACLAALTYQLRSWGMTVVRCCSPQQLIFNLTEAQSLVFPGGADLPYLRRFRAGDYRKIQQFIYRGGKFIGICAGAYFASRFIVFAPTNGVQITGFRPLCLFKGESVGPYPVLSYDKTQYSAGYCVRLSNITGDTLYYPHHGGGYFVIPKPQPFYIQVRAHYSNEHTHNMGPACILDIRYGRGRVFLSHVHGEFSSCCPTLSTQDIPKAQHYAYWWKFWLSKVLFTVN